MVHTKQPPAEVMHVVDAYPPKARQTWQSLRELILETANSLPEIKPLIEDWRTRYEDTLTFIGNREVRLPLDAPLPTEPLRHCIAMAFTYHARKKALS
ncbi:MAG: hypothetical protein AAF296_10890 [Pseudomonadota bacterium]